MSQTGLSKINHRVLQSAGIRVTNQRTLIMDIIRYGEGHLDAEEILRRARRRYPRLSLSTVYRALQLFKGLGLVEEVHFDESHHHYEAKPAVEHYHLICLNCGRVIEFEYPLSRYIKKNIPQAKNFDIVGSEVSVTGYCPDCRQQKK